LTYPTLHIEELAATIVEPRKNSYAGQIIEKTHKLGNSLL
jgi:hypothetical protein